VTSGRRREATALDNDLGQGRRRRPGRITLPLAGLSVAALSGRRRRAPRLTTKDLREEERDPSYSVR